MTAHSYVPIAKNREVLNREVLGELLHSMSQPLTTLRCSLELSLDEAAERQQDAVATALEQTENVIAMLQLMREYLDAQEDRTEAPALALMPLLRMVIEKLSPLAAVRDVSLRLVGTCSAELHVSEWRMRKALEYLISVMIEREPADSEIVLLLEEEPAGPALRLLGKRGFGIAATADQICVPDVTQDDVPFSKNQLIARPSRHDSRRMTMQRVRLAIAARVLENAGAALNFDNNAPGIIVRIPQPRRLVRHLQNSSS